MCCVSEGLNPIQNSTSLLTFSEEPTAANLDMNHLTIQTEDSMTSLLELAANNETEQFKRSIESNPSCVDEIGQWYGRVKGSNQMVNDHRTPLMVAATYGSTDVIKLILSVSDVDINISCGFDRTTALHCAASGGAVNVVEAVKLLLSAGADPNSVDANGCRPIDVIVVSPRSRDVKSTLEELLVTENPRIVMSPSNSNSPPLSPMKSKTEKKEYPIDPSLPDIKNSIYSTDEFRMYSFKVRPCSRAYSHDWTECPFVHPGENARRRDPRKFHYSCVPCPDFRKGACRRADMCEYAHGVFECWLHPAQYRTRLCKDGVECARRVCFFAHTPEELRPLYVSTGSAVPSPRSMGSMDFAAAMNLLPGSPSSMSMMSPSPFSSPMSPSNGMPNSSVGWPQPNVPALHLPGSNFQSSRLRSSLHARDIRAEEFSVLSDFEVQQQQMINDLSTLSLNRSGRMKILTPSNLDDLFYAESLSPRYSDQGLGSAVFSPTHKSAVLNQFQQQQNMLSPINTNYSPKSVDHSLLQGRMSPRNVEPSSPLSSRVSMFAQREKQQQQFRSLSSRELGSGSNGAIVGSPSSSWSKWGSSNGKPDWAVSSDEQLGKLRRSSSFELGNGEEPDLSWVQSLVKESPSDNTKGKVLNPVSTDSSSEGQMESLDHAKLGALLEKCR